MNSSTSSVKSGASGGNQGVKLQPKPVATNPNIAGMGKHIGNPELANVNPLASMQGSYKNQPA